MSQVVIPVGGDVVGLHIKGVFGIIPHELSIKFGIRMIAIHALLPPKTPIRAEVSPDAMGNFGRQFMAEIFQGIERGVDGRLRLVFLVDVGITQSGLREEEPGTVEYLGKAENEVGRYSHVVELSDVNGLIFG